MENTKFCFFCKTFRDDFIYLKRLLESYQKYNEDKIPMYICFPKDDQALYDSQIPNELKINTNLIYEEEFSAYTVATELNGVRPGYVNQEIIKLAFWEKFDVGGGVSTC